uniref:Uncharacterized protein n=1 Tax=Arundo donax TaxID=35708 RepID=A0A0A8YL30_ARUDO
MSNGNFDKWEKISFLIISTNPWASVSASPSWSFFMVP